MDQLLKNKEFKSKMSSLSPGVKQWFINALVDLFEQESEFVIDVLEDCRFELGQTADSYKDEAHKLRAASRMLEERRDGSDRSMSRASEGAVSRLSMIDESTGERRRRERSRRRMCISDDDGRSPSSLSVPSYPVASRTPSPASARTTRSLPVSPSPPSTRSSRGLPVSSTPPSSRAPRDLPTSPVPPPSSKAIEEETKALLKTMTDADAHVERERERQQERLERLRRQKKFLAQDRTAQAMKLLEKALEMDRVLAKDKERQGKLLQDKLQDLKKRRSNNQSASPSNNGTDDIPVIEDLENY